MRNRSLACALVVTLASCAGSSSTQLKDVQVSPQKAAQKPTKALVIGLSAKPDVRAAFEADMASRLQKAGITAVQGHTVMPEDAPLNVESIRAIVKQQGADAVVVARMVGNKEVATAPAVPQPGSENFYGYYADKGPQAYQPDIDTEHVVTLETRLYRTGGDGQLAWKGVSDSFDPKSPTQVIQSVNEKTVERMKKDGVI